MGNVSNILIPTSAHDHGEEAYKRGEFSLRNKLKRAAETSSERLREVFNETCREDPFRNMISFQEISYQYVQKKEMFTSTSAKRCK